MIVQIRGTSGSGKSTAMRDAMMRFGGLAAPGPTGMWHRIMTDGRRRPLYYIHDRTDAVILGHYESPCGGCDTIGSARAVFDLSNTFTARTLVLAEGLLLSEDVKWTTAMSLADDVLCLFLTTPVERCLAQIRTRREAAGNEKPLSEANTRNRVATIERARVRLAEAGVTVRRCSAAQATETVLRLLRLHARREE